MLTEQEKARFLLEEAEQFGDKPTQMDFKPVQIDAAISGGMGMKNELPGSDNPDDAGEYTTSPLQGESEPAGEGATGEGQESQQPQAEGVQFKLSESIKAETVVDLINWIIPLIAIYLSGRFGFSIDKEEMELDKDEKKTLQKPLDVALSQQTVGFKNPWIGFIVMFFVLFGLKLWGAKMAYDQKVQDGEIIDDKTGEPLIDERKLNVKSKRKSRAKAGAKRGRPKQENIPLNNDISLP